jgi:hypothetical protein
MAALFLPVPLSTLLSLDVDWAAHVGGLLGGFFSGIHDFFTFKSRQEGGNWECLQLEF